MTARDLGIVFVCACFFGLAGVCLGIRMEHDVSCELCQTVADLPRVKRTAVREWIISAYEWDREIATETMRELLDR